MFLDSSNPEFALETSSFFLLDGSAAYLCPPESLESLLLLTVSTTSA